MHEIGTKAPVKADKKAQRLGVGEDVRSTSRDWKTYEPEAVVSGNHGHVCPGVPRRNGQREAVREEEPVGVDDEEDAGHDTSLRRPTHARQHVPITRRKVARTLGSPTGRAAH